MKKFGLIDYEVFIHHTDQIEDKRGACSINPTGKIGELYLSKDWGFTPLDKKSICCTAFHEVAELLIGELVACAKDRFTTEDQIEAASHKIIRV